jgi:hypothetical protein
MDAASFVIGLLVGIFFSLVLSHFLAKKVGDAVLAALKEYHGDDDKGEDDPANWWKKGRHEE